MDELSEEEIKIEYNESFETDPLCDKKLNRCQENVEIETICNENTTCFTIEACDANDQNNYYDSNYQHKKDAEKQTENESSWYKSIDNMGRYQCKFCDLKYSTLQTLRYHVKKKHPAEAKHIKESVARTKRNSKMKCQICKQRFKELATLTNHLLDTHSLKDIQSSCFYCDATFCSEIEMKNHLFVHHKKVANKLSYMCITCGYRTLIESHYNQHKNTHFGEKINKCQYCDYATNYLSNLKVHERIHINEKLYVCDYVSCEYKCTSKSALRSHKLKHFPEKNILYCDKCNYKTIYKQSLKRHTDCHIRNSLRIKLS